MQFYFNWYRDDGINPTESITQDEASERLALFFPKWEEMMDDMREAAALNERTIHAATAGFVYWVACTTDYTNQTFETMRGTYTAQHHDGCDRQEGCGGWGWYFRPTGSDDIHYAGPFEHEAEAMDRAQALEEKAN